MWNDGSLAEAGEGCVLAVDGSLVWPGCPVVVNWEGEPASGGYLAVFVGEEDNEAVVDFFPTARTTFEDGLFESRGYVPLTDIVGVDTTAASQANEWTEQAFLKYVCNYRVPKNVRHLRLVEGARVWATGFGQQVMDTVVNPMCHASRQPELMKLLFGSLVTDAVVWNDTMDRYTRFTVERGQCDICHASKKLNFHIQDPRFPDRRDRLHVGGVCQKRLGVFVTVIELVACFRRGELSDRQFLSKLNRVRPLL
jgi:hypothetical protein